jgi:predicted transcriptional regulator
MVNEATPKLLPEELAVKSALPALRASIAKELMEKHGMTQTQIADLLGVTQTAVSYYVRDKRGFGARDSIEEEEVRKTVTEIAAMLKEKEVNRRAVAAKFTEALLYIRKHRLLCNVHKQYEPHLDLTACDVCDSS